MAVLCILYTKFCSSTVSNNTYVLTWNQFDSKDMYLMYCIYTLDMFYNLNFAIVLWIYGTLNKMK